MASARIIAGICGFESTVSVRGDGSSCKVTIESNCPAVQRLAGELKEVEPLGELCRSRDTPQTWQLAARHGLHAACPVPIGILKAIEVEAGLAIPANVLIEVSAAAIQSAGEPKAAARPDSGNPPTAPQPLPSEPAGQGIGPGTETMGGQGMGRGRGMGRGMGCGRGMGRGGGRGQGQGGGMGRGRRRGENG